MTSIFSQDWILITRSSEEPPPTHTHTSVSEHLWMLLNDALYSEIRHPPKFVLNPHHMPSHLVCLFLYLLWRTGWSVHMKTVSGPGNHKVQYTSPHVTSSPSSHLAELFPTSSHTIHLCANKYCIHKTHTSFLCFFSGYMINILFLKCPLNTSPPVQIPF
jgi:hypothetical protein